jgi:hypothetical protein
MSGLPDFLKIPDGLEKFSLPSANLPVSDLIKFPLPLQHKSTVLSLPRCRAKMGFFLSIFQPFCDLFGTF